MVHVTRCFLGVLLAILGLTACERGLVENEPDQGSDYTISVSGVTYGVGDTVSGVGQLIETNDPPEKTIYPIYVDSDDGKLPLFPKGHPSSDGYYQPYLLPEDLQIDSLWVRFKGRLQKV